MSQETINLILVLLAFGAFHSITAATRVKSFMRSMMGERIYLGWYRLLYNILSIVTLAPAFSLMGIERGQTIWSFDGVLAAVFRAAQLVGVVGLVISLLQIDLLRFFGIKQMMAYFKGDKLPLPDEPLTRKGVYALVRHPLYLFTLMFLWFNPIMTASGLGLVIGATLYFTLGSLLEEQKMVHQFGEEYRSYQQQVPWMIPFLKR
ncbi:MAG: methyltransferase family protein [bacterium]